MRDFDSRLTMLALAAMVSLLGCGDESGPLLVADFQPQGLQLFPEIGMGREERFAGLHQLVLSPYPMEGTGSLLVLPLDSRFSLISSGCAGVAGRTLELSNAEGKAFYYDEQGRFRPVRSRSRSGATPRIARWSTVGQPRSTTASACRSAPAV